MYFSQLSIAARIRATAILVFALSIPAVAFLSPVAVADDLSTACVEDGEPGLVNFLGECITATEYDELFGYEALSVTPLHGNTEGVSVATAANITADSPKASERRRVFMGVDQGSFAEVAARLVGGQVAL